MATAIEFNAFRGNAGLALPAGVDTVVGQAPVTLPKNVRAVGQLSASVGIVGGAVKTAVQVTAQIIDPAGNVVASGGTHQDLDPGENLGFISLVFPPSPLVSGMSPVTYTMQVTANPDPVPGAVADCQVQADVKNAVCLIALFFTV